MLTLTDIQKLFARFNAMYPGRWASGFKTQQDSDLAIKVWWQDLRGFRHEDLKVGVQRLTGDWPPSLPQFVRLCLPDLEDLGYDVESEVQKRLPAYKFEATTPSEASFRDRQIASERANVIRGLQVAAINKIAENGLDGLLEQISEKDKAKAALLFQDPKPRPTVYVRKDKPEFVGGHLERLKASIENGANDEPKID